MTDPIIFHIFAFLDTNYVVTYWVFPKIFKPRATLIFQMKVYQPLTDDSVTMDAMEPVLR